jgi:DNA-binding transcriptional ArsR family regulator
MHPTQKKNLKTLALCLHPQRMSILNIIRQLQNPCVSDIIKYTELRQATVSQHLALLRFVNIVSVKSIGTRREYSIVNSNMAHVLETIQEGIRLA